MLDQAGLPWFAELNRGLNDRLDDAGFARRMRETFEQLDALARQIVAQAVSEHPTLDGAVVLATLDPQAGRDATPMLFAAAA